MANGPTEKQCDFIIPPAIEGSREVANLTERWCQRICLSVCLSVTKFDPNYLETGQTE